jgi:RNA polymerase-binding transcription factor DksA
MDCIKCGNEIPSGRLKALPNTVTCVNCSTAAPKRGFRIIEGKTSYSALDIVDQEKYNELTAKQARKGMSPGRGVWMDRR